MRITRLIPAVAAAAVSVLALLSPTASAAPQAPAPTAPVAKAVQPIIGGGYAQNAPWAARLFSNGRETCSATIIAPTWILTAKHCVTGGGLQFRIGSLDQHSGGTVASGVQTYTHSSDLALVRLDRSVSATYATLGQPGTVRVGQNVQVWGWGATSQCGSEANCQSRYLKVADVTVTSGCTDAYGGSAICARRGNGITAGGDSGGPMTLNGVQVGVASTSDRQTTTAYTNVTAYRSWIQQIAGV
ncbi:trypsin [Streptomyces nitrosporeus]|uniref:Trypsin n=1 Tax=Streptomyces nitrosporeus TaxID=28894 RepID=A0A5J6F965_9ACTN|nr:trypsin-like serine protease [Streptomyces nitrosporeus]QEU72878.1 trypsin [Streptomyces nitrosporeus]GGZ13286.1 hydrolase [Streptomyces nitrosporeus]